MKTIFHSAASRGHANHGWLDTYHSFSFAGYFNPERMNFGALRVLNDDKVSGGMGFGQHPHRDMEIITIPLKGALKHGDNMGNSGVIKKGQVQVMSAGTGIIHSETNANANENVEFLQIWILPNKQAIKPRYEELNLSENIKNNALTPIISPEAQENSLWIHQKAWMNWGQADSNQKIKYKLNKNENGVYIFLLEGEIKISGKTLSKRDAIGIWDTEEITIETKNDSEFIVIEVPMN